MDLYLGFTLCVVLTWSLSVHIMQAAKVKDEGSLILESTSVGSGADPGLQAVSSQVT